MRKGQTTICCVCFFFIVFSLSKRIFLNLPVFNDHNELFVWIRDEVQVLARVPVDQDQVGIGAFRDDAEFRIRIWITRAGKGEYLRVVVRHHLQRFIGRVPLLEQGDQKCS